MATVFTSPAVRASLLRLPPHLRVATVQRSFSTTRPRQSLVDIIAAPPSYLLSTLHSTGLPWYAVLPLSAVIVRGFICYYVAARPNQKAAQIQSNLIPIIAANVMLTNNDPDRIREKENMKKPQLKRLEDRWFKFRTTNRLMREMGKQFGATGMRWRSLANFGMLIAMTEAIRMKCGSHEGLLSLLLTPFQWLWAALRDDFSTGTVAAPTIPLAVPTSREQLMAELMAERLEQGKTLDVNGNTVYDFSSLPPPARPDVVYAPYTDVSMQTEGFSWITDLSAPDPTFTLPVLLWLAISLNIILRPSIGSRSTIQQSRDPDVLVPREVDPQAQAVFSHPQFGAKVSKNFLGIFPPVTNLQRIGLSIGLVFGFAMLKLPAGILLYMLPSLAVGWLQGRYLNVRYPVRPSIKPCLRPLRLRVRRQWND